MNQCVPSWDIDDPPNKDPPLPPHLLPLSSSVHHQLSMSDYEVAELTWENGQLLAHGLVKPTPRYPPSAAGTLESIVDQAKLFHNQLPSATAIDALVPKHRRQREDLVSGIGSCDIGDNNRRKKARLRDFKGTTTTNCTSRDDTCGVNSVTPFGDDENGGGGTPDTENTSFGGGGASRAMTVVDDHDSVCHSQRSLSQKGVAGEEDEKVTEGGTMRSTISTKRSRAATVHNQSERKRRDRINQRMRTLQKLVPNSSKTDKASILNEVINYLKQLQAQVQMMRGMGAIPPMVMPMGMQQFQMTMMTQMAQMAQMAQMGMGMGMMDMASLGRAGPTGISPVIPTSAFVPMIGGSWDPSLGRMQQPTGAVMPDPFSAFVACPSQQQMTLDTYQRMATLYQQMFHQTQPTNPK